MLEDTNLMFLYGVKRGTEVVKWQVHQKETKRAYAGFMSQSYCYRLAVITECGRMKPPAKYST